MRLLMTGGGTAGHINPALAIANYCMDKEPGSEILFVGTEEGLETGLVPHSGYPLELIKVHGLNQKISFQTLKALSELPGAVHNAKKIIQKFRPDAVVGTGGYVCGPVLYAAAGMKLPTVIHESNALPGVTTRLLSGKVDTVALGVEDAAPYLKKAHHVITVGTPVRPALLLADKQEAKRKMNPDGKPFLIFFGGSLGAKEFNRTAVDFICGEIAKGGSRFRILMGTGKFHQYDDVMKRFRQNGVNPEQSETVTVQEYIYDMDMAMNAADIVICRAGAGTLAELTALGKASVLVPSPYVAENHQEHNARALERHGAAKVILENEFSAEALEKAVEEMTANPQQLQKMQNAAKAIGHTDVSEKMYEEIRRLITEYQTN